MNNLEQRDQIKPFLALEASAGSGKTFALSVRYLALLFLGANPSKILTLTFTNKAAAEMKVRIYEALKNLEKSDELPQVARQAGLSTTELLAKKEQVLERFLHADLSIATIDSFFASTLRKFAQGAGLMPDFRIEPELPKEELFKKFLRTCKDEGKYATLIHFSINQEKKPADFFALLHSFYVKQSEFDATVFSETAFMNPQQILQRAAAIKVCLERAGASSTAIKSFEVESIKELMGKGYIKRASLEYRTYAKYLTPEIQELFAELLDDLRTFLRAREAYLLGELGALFAIYKKSRRVLNAELATLSFADVDSWLYTLLQDEISRDFLYFRLDGVIEHILIDEFQDTNITQYKILEPLLREIVSGIGAKEFASLFFVGDIKQSIYRFRGGAKELFAYALRDFGVSREVLDTNYRSAKNIVEYVNTLFAPKISGYEIQKPHKKQEGFVRVVLDDALLESILQNTRYLLEKGVPYDQIAILVHKNDDALVIKEFLCEHIPHIKVQTEVSRRLIAVPIVQAIIDLLKFAYFKDAIYKHNFLAVIGQGDKKDLDVSWINFESSTTQIIVSIVRYFELFSGDIDIIKLIELSARYSDIESFLFACDDLREEAKSQDNDGIRIITIHKSKGLQFAHVIVADRLGAANNKKDTLLYAYEEIHLRAIYERVSAREYIDQAYSEAKEQEEILSEEDRINMHYVAFTRAKNSLIVCAKETKSAFELLSLQALCWGAVLIEREQSVPQPPQIKMQEAQVSYGSQEKSKNTKEEQSDFLATQYGLAMHHVLELMSAFDAASLKRAFVSCCNKYALILGSENLQSIYKRVTRLINDARFAALVLDAKIYREQPIAYNGERKQLDLLLEKEHEVIVVDYKSSAQVNALHVAQIGLYKKALQRIYDKKVSAYLCYLREDAIEFVTA